MTEYHLIAHKVRGEPAFDIAHELTAANGEEMWICSTSGHRAYPYWNVPLRDLLIDDIPEMPETATEHYTATSMNDKIDLKGDGVAFLKMLGIQVEKQVDLNEPKMRRI
jgi:hypothetical protein